MQSTVLVVEDDADLRAGIALGLEEDGYEPLCAADGEEALAVLRGDRGVDVVLSDLVMPRMTGLELVREMRRDPALEGIPFVLMSASTNIHSIQSWPELDGVEMLSKPLTLGLLLDVVRNKVSEARRSRTPV